MCSQWSASSVDNVKDPVLAMLLQNPKTANITGALSCLKVGSRLSIPELADVEKAYNDTL